MTTRMTAQDIATRQTEAWNRHDAAGFAAGYAENVNVDDPVYPEPLAGRSAVQQDATDYMTAFPDVTFQLKSVISDGDKLIYEGVISGTHLGPLTLPSGLVPATNKHVEFAIAGFSTIDEAGIIREERRYYDVAGILGQLGLMQ